jgi:hypothetical protein
MVFSAFWECIITGTEVAPSHRAMGAEGIHLVVFFSVHREEAENTTFQRQLLRQTGSSTDLHPTVRVLIM